MFGLNINYGEAPRTSRQKIGTAWSEILKPQNGTASGLIVGTRIATGMGWRAVEALTEGDLVLTFDHGMQPIKSVKRGYLWNADTEIPNNLWPIFVPEGACGNKSAMMVLPEQAIMLESDMADLIYGDPFSLVKTGDLVGYRGIERIRPADVIEVIEIEFETAEIVFAETGGLFLCNLEDGETVLDLIDHADEDPEYKVLSADEAKLVLDTVTPMTCAMSDPFAQPTVKARYVA